MKRIQEQKKTTGNERPWEPKVIRLLLVGHFLRADFCRVFGSATWEQLKALADHEDGGLVIEDHRLLRLAREGERAYKLPTVEYLRLGKNLYAVELGMRDTLLPYGGASLERHSQTFLGLGKSAALTSEEKSQMRATFQARPADAYGYAMVDTVNTLLISEEMEKKDQEIYSRFGFPPEDVPELRATLGSRVSTFIKATTMQRNNDGVSSISDRALEELMHGGGLRLFTDHPDASRYGPQTGATHGGLLYSRSPTRFWHEAPGMLRDVDMAGCYNQVTARLNVYWGRPLIFEPGSAGWTLQDAVAYLQKHSDDDAWLVRVTGAIKQHPNALVPSTEDALTSTNYQQKLGRGVRRSAHRQAFRLEALRDPEAVKKARGTKLYAACVESGVVTLRTWLMIQALPEAWRREYEALTAESLVFYPAKLVADDATQLRRLQEQLRSGVLPWQAELDLESMLVKVEEKVDGRFLALRFPIGEYARQIGKFRKEARDAHGKGCGAELAWKVHANSMYGVLASRHMPTNNFVAANQITAWARAEAFAVSQALNAIQTITDGCTYRLDQVPACTYAECLRLQPDYPIRRAEAGGGIPFLDPAGIPQEDAAFTAWYRAHVQRFFQVSGSNYERLFETHGLEHKKTGDPSSAAFDALACDGAGNYAKCVRAGQDDWRVTDFAARSYGRKCKEQIAAWLVPTYSQDRFTAPPPLTEDAELLSFKKACLQARKALEPCNDLVYFPLGLENRKVLNYRTVKASAFIFETPEQRGRLLKQLQKFEEEHAGGLELLTLRRSYQGRQKGSLGDLVRALYQLIRRGDDDLIAGLNLHRLPPTLVTLARARRKELGKRKAAAQKRLFDAIAVELLEDDDLLTGLQVSSADLRVLGESAAAPANVQ